MSLTCSISIPLMQMNMLSMLLLQLFWVRKTNVGLCWASFEVALHFNKQKVYGIWRQLPTYFGWFASKAKLL